MIDHLPVDERNSTNLTATCKICASKREAQSCASNCPLSTAKMNQASLKPEHAQLRCHHRDKIHMSRTTAPAMTARRSPSFLEFVSSLFLSPAFAIVKFQLSLKMPLCTTLVLWNAVRKMMDRRMLFITEFHTWASFSQWNVGSGSLIACNCVVEH